MFLAYDITSTVSWYFNQVSTVILPAIFDTLNAFSFFGFTFFEFILALGLLSVIIQMIIATPKQKEKNPKGGK